MGNLIVLGMLICQTVMARGVAHWEPIEGLHPTQFAAGLYEVEAKTGKLQGMDAEERKEYLADRFVPVILGPGGTRYLVDRHHMTLAALRAGIKKVYVKVIEDWSDLSTESFWKRMRAADYAYLYDENGGGPHSPELLPETLEGLVDDPYRSLAWLVRKQGGYEKTDKSFQDSLWANFFRKRIAPWNNDEELDDAVDEGVRLAGTAAAKNLPGFSGRRGLRCSLSIMMFGEMNR